MPDKLTPPDTIVIEDVNQFVGLLSAWHDDKVKVLEHMLQIPDGTEMVINGTDSSVLTGDLLKGFRAGIELSLMELGTLPLVAETVDVAEPATEPADAPDASPTH